jgi:hypothetical protein
MKGYIYKITSPSGRIYIGQTTDIHKRVNDYNSLHCKAQTKLYNSFLKYSWISHIFETIEELDYNKEILDQLEIKYIIKFKCVEYGLNCKTGGSNGLHSQETKIKMSEVKLGKKHSEETKDKIGKSNKGKKRSSEFSKSISIRRSGCKASEETKKKMSNLRKGKKKSPTHLEKLREHLKTHNKSKIGSKHSEETKKKMSESQKKRAHIKKLLENNG